MPLGNQRPTYQPIRPVPSHGRVSTIGPNTKRPTTDTYDWFKQIREISRDWNNESLQSGKTPPAATRWAENLSGNTDDILNASPAMAGATVWHGTGAPKFSKFRSSKIGSGEGAQAYGYGHYFAGDPRTAATYFEQLKKINPGLLWRGKPVNSYLEDLDSPEIDYLFKKTDRPFRQAYDDVAKSYKYITEAGQDFATTTNQPMDYPMALRLAVENKRASLASDIKSHKGYLRRAQNDIDTGIATNHSREALVSYLKVIENLRLQGRYARQLGKEFQPRPEQVQGGILKVDLPDDAINNMVRWDAPMKEQPKAVLDFVERDPVLFQRALREFGTPKDQWLKTDPRNLPMTGQDIYRWSRSGGMNERELADKFQNKGVPGIKYLSGMTRRGRDWNSPNTEDFNYVSFSDDLPKIKEYYDWNKLRQGGFDWYDIGR